MPDETKTALDDLANSDAVAQLEDLVEKAKPIELRDMDGKIHLVGGWPEIARFSVVMLAGNAEAMKLEHSGETLKFTLANAHAAYDVIDEVEGVIYARLTSDYAALFWNAMIDAIAPPEGK